MILGNNHDKPIMNLYKQIKINVTHEHHHELSITANKLDMSIAQYIREELNIDIKNPPKRHFKIYKEKITKLQVDDSLIYHLSKIGTNINQIARGINSKDYDNNLILLELIKIKEEIDDYKYK